MEQVSKEKKVTYERLSDHEAATALVMAIWALRPRKSTYRAANYILDYAFYTSPRVVRMSLTDDKKRLISEVTIDCTDRFTTTVTFKPPGMESIPVAEQDFKRIKSALRQLLPAIVFQDYTDTREPKVAPEETTQA